MPHKIAVSRKEHFNAAHRLHNPVLSDESNKEIYGKCNSPNYHGHNYELVVSLVGEVNPITGYVVDTAKLSQIIRLHVTDLLDHKNLNVDIPALMNTNPTTENIAIFIYEILRPLIDQKLTLKITLYETERNYVEYPA